MDWLDELQLQPIYSTPKIEPIEDIANAMLDDVPKTQGYKKLKDDAQLQPISTGKFQKILDETKEVIGQGNLSERFCDKQATDNTQDQSSFDTACIPARIAPFDCFIEFNCEKVFV
jgi:hypothetical protein